jgi:hypothetical protein
MPHDLTWTDRLRIERAVWALDQRLYDLPRKARIARRRELRENLFIASQDVGVAAALRNLGDSRQLAAEYLAAQFGDGARPSWYSAAVFLFTGQLVFTSLLSEATSAFGDGIATAQPGAAGTYTWAGISYLQSSVSYTFVDGAWSSVGGAWTPLAWGLWLGATVLVGRLWRIPSTWRRRHAARA